MKDNYRRSQVRALHLGVTTSADSHFLDDDSATEDVTEEQLKVAEKGFMDARATYILRQSVIDDVITADPMLKAVHAATNASSSER